MQSWERYEQDSVMVAMPIHPSLRNSEPKHIVFSALLNARKPMNWWFFPVYVWEIGNARDLAVKTFLKNKFTHLLFLDADIVLNQDTIERLLLGRKPVLSATYFEKGGKMESTFHKHSMVPDRRAEDMWIENGGIQEVELLGAGCMMIERWVLENLTEPYFSYSLSDTSLKPEDRISEDYYFAYVKLFKELGIRPYGDFDNIVGHLSPSGVVYGKGKVKL